MIVFRELNSRDTTVELHGPGFPSRSESERRRLEEYTSVSEKFIGVYYLRGELPELLGVFGFIRPSIIDSSAYVWFVDTPELVNHKIGFLRGCVQAIKAHLSEFEKLVGVCVNEKALPWITWLGGAFREKNPRGWYPFEMRING